MQVDMCALQEPIEKRDSSRWRWMRKGKFFLMLGRWYNHCLLVISFFKRAGLPGSVERVEFLECRLGPDAEASDVATRRDLEEIEALDVDEGRARDVTEGARDAVVLRVDDERAATLDATTVAHLTLTSPEATTVLHLKRDSTVTRYSYTHRCRTTRRHGRVRFTLFTFRRIRFGTNFNS